MIMKHEQLSTTYLEFMIQKTKFITMIRFKK